MSDLSRKITLVTGASRGAGRAIAKVLGEAGATVYVTGRSVRDEQTSRQTIDETAELVTAQGGRGIAVACDHTVDAEVAALFARLQQEAGRLDLLVNNVWGGYENYDGETFDAPFWEQPLWRWDKMFAAGVRAHYTASRLAAPMMIRQRQGLIINTTAWDRQKYLGSLPYDVAKAAINRLAYGMALELRPHHIAVVALAPGWMRTEAVLDHFGVTEETWHEVEALSSTESPHYIGRAIAALADDPAVIIKSGRVLTVGRLAQEYNFTDVDGRQPPPFEIPADHLLD